MDWQFIFVREGEDMSASFELNLLQKFNIMITKVNPRSAELVELTITIPTPRKTSENVKIAKVAGMLVITRMRTAIYIKQYVADLLGYLSHTIHLLRAVKPS